MENEAILGKSISKFRVILLGNQLVGKTSLIVQYLNNQFNDEYFPTKDIVYLLINLVIKNIQKIT